jgi:hypothetical protein
MRLSFSKKTGNSAANITYNGPDPQNKASPVKINEDGGCTGEYKIPSSIHF